MASLEEGKDDIELLELSNSHSNGGNLVHKTKHQVDSTLDSIDREIEIWKVLLIHNLAFFRFSFYL